MKILIVLNDGNWGGVAHTVFDSLKVFGASNMYIVFGSQGPAIDKFKTLNIPYDIIDFSGSQYHIPPLRALYSLVRKKHVDLIHAHHPRAYLRTRVIAKLLNIPHISTPHVALEDELALIPGRPAKKAYLRLRERLFARLDQYTVALSLHDKNQLVRQGSDEKKVIIIPNGIDLKKFDHDTVKPIKIKDVSDEDFLLGVVGRLSPQKGLDDLLQQFASLPSIVDGRRVKLVMVGDGPERPSIENFIKERHLEDRVVLMGNMATVECVFARLNLVLFSSYWETLPTALLEALAMAKPVIAVDIPSYKNILLGKYGILVPRERFGQTIKQNIPIPKSLQDMASAGRLHVMQYYDVRIQAQSLKNLYRKCLATSSES